MEINPDTLRRARAWCARQYHARRPSHRHEHPSFLGSKILEECETRFEIPTHGVEGFCDQLGKHGISYLNTGDTYETTIVFRSRSESFVRACWGSYANFK